MFWSAADIPDRHDKVAVITGADGGLGLASARNLAGNASAAARRRPKTTPVAGPR